MLTKTVRCNVCSRIHTLAELINRKKLADGTFTFTCPIRKAPGAYKPEDVGTPDAKARV